jgi:hypothetical protein
MFNVEYATTFYTRALLPHIPGNSGRTRAAAMPPPVALVTSLQLCDEEAWPKRCSHAVLTYATFKT